MICEQLLKQLVWRLQQQVGLVEEPVMAQQLTEKLAWRLRQQHWVGEFGARGVWREC